MPEINLCIYRQLICFKEATLYNVGKSLQQMVLRKLDKEIIKNGIRSLFNTIQKNKLKIE